MIELSSPLPSVEKEWTHNKSCGFLTLLLKLMKICNLGQKLLLCGFSSCSCCRDKIYLDHLSFFKILSEFQGEQNCRPQQLRKWTFYFDKVKNGHLTLSESSKKSANAFCILKSIAISTVPYLMPMLKKLFNFWQMEMQTCVPSKAKQGELLGRIFSEWKKEQKAIR